MKYNPAMAHRFTVGVEEEFQIVDPETCELRSHVTELLASSAPTLGDQIKRELHQSIVEVGTKICENIGELHDEIFRIRRELTGERRARRAGGRGGGHASLLALEGPDPLARASATTASSRSSSSSRGRC